MHELHIWRLSQEKSIASAHVVVDCTTVAGFVEKAKIIRECLHAYGIHSATLQPEFRGQVGLHATPVSGDAGLAAKGGDGENFHCQLRCEKDCAEARCCG